LEKIAVITNPRNFKKKLRDAIGTPTLIEFSAGEHCKLGTLTISTFVVWVVTTEIEFGALYHMNSGRNDRIIDASFRKGLEFININGTEYSEWRAIGKSLKITEDEFLRELESWISCETIKAIIKSKHLQKLHKLPKQLRVSIPPMINHETKPRLSVNHTGTMDSLRGVC